MLASERIVLENGSLTDMRNLFKLAKLRKAGAMGELYLMFGYMVAAFRGHILPYSEGNYILSNKGERFLISEN